MRPNLALRSIKSEARQNIAMTSEATVISKPDSLGMPLAVPPKPITILRKALSLRSMTLRKTILRGSMLSSLPC